MRALLLDKKYVAVYAQENMFLISFKGGHIGKLRNKIHFILYINLFEMWIGLHKLYGCVVKIYILELLILFKIHTCFIVTY